MERRRKNRPYEVMLLIYLVFILTALIVDSPQVILQGLWKILISKSVLITDYMAVGGIGAALVNSSIVGLFSIFVLSKIGIRPNGSIIMAMWMSTGFAMFGKNILNMLPLVFGVWLYSKVKKEPMMNYALSALLSTTMSPVVSGIALYDGFSLAVGIPLGIFAGVAAGFVFSPVSSFIVRAHGGYNLYNMGMAGGLITTFIVSAFSSVGISIPNELIWSSGNNLTLAILLYVVSAGLILYGVFATGKFKLPPYKKIMESSGRLVSDYLVLHGYAAYFNMGLMGVLATTLTLVLGADLNGATLCAIFAIIGYSSFGKHLRNVTPVLIGALICTFVNIWSPTSPNAILAVLFSTGLAPIAGQFGWIWGIVAGFLHVNTIMHIGFLTNGLNLYNNGYAAGFVALLLVPIMMAFQKEGGNRKYGHRKRKKED